jgi:hypothetical protein
MTNDDLKVNEIFERRSGSKQPTEYLPHDSFLQENGKGKPRTASFGCRPQARPSLPPF